MPDDLVMIGHAGITGLTAGWASAPSDLSLVREQVKGSASIAAAIECQQANFWSTLILLQLRPPCTLPTGGAVSEYCPSPDQPDVAGRGVIYID